MTKKVCKFFELIGKHTGFDRGDTKFRAFLGAHLERKHTTYPRFMNYFQEVWNDYIKNDVGINLSRFFIENGKAFMKKWYTDVFPFPKRRIDFEFKQGGSQVDVLITIKYQLTEVELECLNEIIQKYQIKDKTINAAALIALLEPCVLLGMALSKLIGQEIRVSIEDRSIEKNLITLELSVRPR